MSDKIKTLKSLETNQRYDYIPYININSFSTSSANSLNKLVKPLSFENKQLGFVSYELPVEELISKLVSQISTLNKRIESLEKANSVNSEGVLIAQDSLKAIWDNEQDNVWDKL